MGRLLDKSIIFICCCIFFVATEISLYTVVPIIVAIIISAVMTIFDLPVVKISGYLLFLILCSLYPDLLYFTPLMCYDLFCESYKYVYIIALPVFYFKLDYFSFLAIISLLITTILVFLLKTRSNALELAKNEFFILRDESLESNEKLNVMNKDLLEKQEYEINTATLNERNRIAREIHDTVGHLLSSSILQIGALMAITKDELVKDSLVNIKDTLSTGMDSIRNSIHNIHEESINLEDKLNELVKHFNFCNITFNYKINTDLSVKAKYSIIFIVKECLSNVIKHSNATKVSIVLTELPGLYQIIISDNGTNIHINTRSGGMGITSILDRVNGLGGNVNLNTNNGYKLFITLPKLNK